MAPERVVPGSIYRVEFHSSGAVGRRYLQFRRPGTFWGYGAPFYEDGYQEFTATLCADAREFRLQYWDACGAVHYTTPVVTTWETLEAHADVLAPDDVELGEVFSVSVVSSEWTSRQLYFRPYYLPEGWAYYLDTPASGDAFSTPFAAPATPGGGYFWLAYRDHCGAAHETPRRRVRWGCGGTQCASAALEGRQATWQVFAPSGFACGRPTILVIHGFNSDPMEEEWIRCLVQALGADSQRYPTGVNVLVADATYYMDFNEQEALWEATQAAVREVARLDAIPGAARARAAAAAAARELAQRFAHDFLRARLNIGSAGRDLATFINCTYVPCAGGGIDLVIGHSFGGGIAAELGADVVACQGIELPRLLTIDTPWRYTFLARQSNQARSSYRNHLNLYSDCLIEGGFGNALASAPNLRNLAANLGDGGLTSLCGFDHTCLPELACGQLENTAFRGLLDGAAPAGDYGIDAQGAITAGPTTSCASELGRLIDDVLSPLARVLLDGIEALLGDRMQAGVAGDHITLLPDDDAQPALVSGVVPFPPEAGFLTFEYRVCDAAPGQDLILSWNGVTLWSVTRDPGGPPCDWELAVVPIAALAGQVGRFSIYFEAPRTAAPDVAEIRRLRVVDRAVFECQGPPQVAHQPIGRSVQAGETAVFFVSTGNGYDTRYRWRRDGIPLSDGLQAGGSSVVGAESPVLSLVRVALADSGNYDCVITTRCGSVTSDGAILNVRTAAPGDLNCDGHINNFDIDAFVLALSDPAAYEAAYPGCDRMNADIDGDGAVTNFDIDPFVALLGG